MTVRRRILSAAVGLVAVGPIIAAIGYFLPQDHVASVQGYVGRAPGVVFAQLSDVARYPDWRPDVQHVVILSHAPLTWREQSGSDVITYEVVERDPPRRLVVRIADPSLPFGGSWTYDLRPEGAGAHLTMTERGEVYNPVFRFMSRFVFGHTATLEKVLRWLALADPDESVGRR